MSETYADLESELVDLGRALVVDEPPSRLVDDVLARLATDPSPVADPSAISWWRGRSRRVRIAVAALAAAIGLAFVPPVRAAVQDLLRIGGVEIRPAPTLPTAAPTLPTTSPTSATRPVGRALSSLDEARRSAGFAFRTPASLGDPHRVELLEDGRVVALTWGSGGSARHLDVFDGTLDWGYLKTVWADVQPTDVGDRDGVWLSGSHFVRWVDRSGANRSSVPRLAGPTLIWTDVGGDGRELTYRLEGVADRWAAVDVARSLR